MNAVLLGAGGHARAVVETTRVCGIHICAYVDQNRSDWLDARHVSDDEAMLKEGPSDSNQAMLLGLGGITPKQLEHRLSLFRLYLARNWDAPRIIHRRAIISPSALIGEGSMVLAGSVVQPGATLGKAVIVNTLSVIEHDVQLGDGTHVAPGAIVLGGCRIGECCIIGAGTVVLPETVIQNNTLVRAAIRYPESS